MKLCARIATSHNKQSYSFILHVFAEWRWHLYNIYYAPLICASKCNHIDVVIYLCENGANIHARNEASLRWAARMGNLDIVQYLHKNGADIHVRNEDALRYSAYYGHLDVVRYLHKNGADIHANDEGALRWSACNANFDIARYLLDHGANIDNAISYANANSLHNTYNALIKIKKRR